jgi:hypothetical protein
MLLFAQPVNPVAPAPEAPAKAVKRVSARVVIPLSPCSMIVLLAAYYDVGPAFCFNQSVRFHITGDRPYRLMSTPRSTLPP